MLERIRRSVMLAVGAALALLFWLTTGMIASAHDVGEAKYSYQIVTLGGAPWYRCASRSNLLADIGSTIGWASTSYSDSEGFCLTAYEVAAGNIYTEPGLWRWNQGNLELCDSKSGSNPFNDTDHTEQDTTPSSQCGSGDYQVFSGHRVYILGTPYSSSGASGVHSFK